MKVATHFLLSSPPGELKEVLKDVKKIVPGHLLGDAALLSIFRTYNLDQLVIADIPNDERKLLVCAQTEVDDSHYIESTTQQLVEFNHISQECVGISGAAPQGDAALEPQRAAIDAKIAAYVKKQYSVGRTAHAVVSKDGEIHVIIAGLNTNLRNYWSGNWRSVWKVALNGDSAAISGSMKALVHYFEDGNVQMDADKSVDAQSLSFADADSLGDAVAGAISEAESAMQGGLEKLYSNMTDETFKDMRRVLPVTRTKFDWSGAASRLAGGSGARK